MGIELLSKSPILYKGMRRSPQFLGLPLISMSTNSIPNHLFNFSHHHHHHNRKLLCTMATCIHSSTTTTTENPNSQTNFDGHVYNYVKYCRPNFPDLVSYTPKPNPTRPDEFEDLWLRMKDEARADVEQEPILANFYDSSILSQDSIEGALSNLLSLKLSDSSLPRGTLREIFAGILGEEREIVEAVITDLKAVKERDPACISYVHCFLNFKGFLAIQSHRVAHVLWSRGRKILALLIQSRVSEAFAVDIHPGAVIGQGILLDHATGVVIGETAVIGDNVSILHNVTLGGTGKASGDRHPKIGNGVLIGAATCVLGNVRIGDGAKIGAGSVVLKELPARTTAVGNPARLIGGKENPVRHDKMPSLTMDHTSHISELSDYVI